MYCKNCGKVIDDGSNFCEHCGIKLNYAPEVVQADNSKENELSTSNEKKFTYDSPEQTNKSFVANEIVMNFRLIVYAAGLVALYLFAFYLFHLDDIKRFDRSLNHEESYWGESCYDPEILYNTPITAWEHIYYDKLYEELYGAEALYREEAATVSPRTTEQSLKLADKIEKDLNKKIANNEKKHLYIIVKGEKQIMYGLDGKPLTSEPYQTPEHLKEEAKKEATKNTAEFCEIINDYRHSGFEKDLKKHALYSAIICLSLLILGRYLIKAIKWTNKNKTL